MTILSLEAQLAALKAENEALKAREAELLAKAEDRNVSETVRHILKTAIIGLDKEKGV